MLLELAKPLALLLCLLAGHDDRRAFGKATGY